MNVYNQHLESRKILTVYSLNGDRRMTPQIKIANDYIVISIYYINIIIDRKGSGRGKKHS